MIYLSRIRSKVVFAAGTTFEEAKGSITEAAVSAKNKISTMASNPTETASASAQKASEAATKLPQKLEGKVDPKVLPSLSNYQQGTQAQTKIPAPAGTEPIQPGSVIPTTVSISIIALMHAKIQTHIT